MQHLKIHNSFQMIMFCLHNRVQLVFVRQLDILEDYLKVDNYFVYHHYEVNDFLQYSNPMIDHPEIEEKCTFTGCPFSTESRVFFINF